ncbi:hypothetical protein JCM3263A_21580 [Thermobifida fusca]|uniref:Methylamine utilisation protein MauE domain-containing protein n=2 Tax=Thermobifida fusca TaxID=2021 RepID=A0A9P2T7H4_THEFU|nr:MauE/DoxX family redox-associated membrane protein [Thermobifida fusca]AAZ57053.1 hypothetical protein Tfu_3020 [Thermobifida fusca YX]EOR69965.1 hypothetical protein TM51_15486 [Thermobifida fusca TM51]PZN65823.1 MAG: hypothetical protein DIU53_02915 [Thermobifida fusca]QOS59481.1 hypothetical protein IM867_03430 [Thermobifida fusca]
MSETLQDVQLWILTAVLLLGAGTKAVDRTAQGPAVLLPVPLRRPFTVAHAAVEAGLAAGLLFCSGGAAYAVRGATAVLFAVGLVALVRLRQRDPEMGCGCFGGLSTEPIGWRALTRSGLFLAAAVATFGLPHSGWAALVHATPWHGVLCAAEVAVVAVLSPELREAVVRLRSPVPCELREVSRKQMVRRLHASREWHKQRPLLASPEPVDTWRHGCWWFARFAGQEGDREFSVVFAVEVGRRRPDVRSLVVEPPAE